MTPAAIDVAIAALNSGSTRAHFEQWWRQHYDAINQLSVRSPVDWELIAGNIERYQERVNRGARGEAMKEIAG